MATNTWIKTAIVTDYWLLITPLRNKPHCQLKAIDNTCVPGMDQMGSTVVAISLTFCHWNTGVDLI